MYNGVTDFLSFQLPISQPAVNVFNSEVLHIPYWSKLAVLYTDDVLGNDRFTRVDFLFIVIREFQCIDVRWTRGLSSSCTFVQ